jgi:hypothetical protein
VGLVVAECEELSSRRVWVLVLVLVLAPFSGEVWGNASGRRICNGGDGDGEEEEFGAFDDVFGDGFGGECSDHRADSTSTKL